MPPDRHSSVRHFVIDTGHVILTYGARPKAELDFSSRFCSRSEDLYLDPLADCPTEDLRIGDMVVIEGESNRYFSMISDIQLRITDSRLQASPPHEAPPLVAHALAGTATYATVEVKPMLMLDITDDLDEATGPQPVRTISMHFAALYAASEIDLETVFG